MTIIFAGGCTQVSPTLVNGMLRPRIVTPLNQVERWRIIFAGSPLCLDSSNPDECISNAGCKEGDLQCQFAAEATNNYPAPTVCPEQTTTSPQTENLVSTAPESASKH